MNPRTVGALTLRPIGNGQGSFYFLSIATGRVLNRLHATALPMPDDVIDKLHRMALQQKNNPGLVFADRNLNPDEYDDDKDDETYHDDDSTSDDKEDVLSYNEEEDNDLDEDAEENDAAPAPPVAEIDDDFDDDNNDGDVAEEVDMQLPAEAEADQPEEEANQNEDDDEADLPEIQGVDEEVIEPEVPEVGTVEENEEGEEEDQPTEDEATGQPPPASPQGNGRYNLQNNRNRNYGHRYAGKDFVMDSVAMTTHGTSEVLETPQMSLKAGLRAFGDDGVKAVEKEMCQLHDRGVMAPVHKKSSTPEQRKEALAFLMFLKQKRCRKVKGRGCVDGRKQRAFIAKEESTAPTVSTEAVFLTAVIDALEGREVAVLDVPGAFMEADIDELVHVRFSGEMVSML